MILINLPGYKSKHTLSSITMCYLALPIHIISGMDYNSLKIKSIYLTSIYSPPEDPKTKVFIAYGYNPNETSKSHCIGCKIKYLHLSRQSLAPNYFHRCKRTNYHPHLPLRHDDYNIIPTYWIGINMYATKVQLFHPLL